MLVEKFSLSNLLKLELPEFADEVIRIVDKHDPESLKIKDGFDQLVAERPQIEALTVRFGPHPLTEKLAVLREERIEHAKAITFQLNGFVKGFIEGEDSDISTAKFIVNRFLYNLDRNNVPMTNRRVTQFFAEIDKDEDLETAFSSLGLSNRLDSLRSSHSQVLGNMSSRLENTSQRPKGKSEVFKRSIRYGLNWLFATINMAQNYNKELDYTPLIKELNDLIVSYRALIKIRSTYNAKKSESLPETVELDAAVEAEDNEKFKRMVIVDDFDQSMDQKKTVASLSEHLQLPLKSNEA